MKRQSSPESRHSRPAPTTLSVAQQIERMGLNQPTPVLDVGDIEVPTVTRSSTLSGQLTEFRETEVYTDIPEWGSFEAGIGTLGQDALLVRNGVPTIKQETKSEVQTTTPTQKTLWQRFLRK